MARTPPRALLAFLLCLIPCGLKAQGVVMGQETTITYSGTNIPIVPPNTPALNFSSPNGTNTFLIPIPNPSVSLRIYITNNTANPCSAFNAQLWAASDGQTSSFNNALANWQVIPLQSTSGTLIQSLPLNIPISGITYFDTTAISSPRVALQLVNNGGGCATTNIEVTGVATQVAKTSPLISANGPGFSASGNQVQGIVPSGGNGSIVNPVVLAGLGNPQNLNFTAVGLDAFSVGSVSFAGAQSGTFPIVVSPAPTGQGELGLAIEASVAGGTIASPWTTILPGCAGASPQLCAATLAGVTSATPYSRFFPINGAGGNDLGAILLFTGNGVFLRQQANAGAIASVSFAGTNTGDTLVAAIRCINNTPCAVSGVTDTQGLTWARVVDVNGLNPTVLQSKLSIWASTQPSSNTADTITFTFSTSSNNGIAAFDIGGTVPANLTSPAIPLQVDPLGNLIIRQDAQAPNQWKCALTLSTNTTTQCQAAPTTINNLPVRLYLTDLQVNTTTAGTATVISLVTGTGTNCATGQTSVSSINYSDTVVGLSSFIGRRTPLVLPIQQALCITQSGTTAGTVTVEAAGFLAP